MLFLSFYSLFHLCRGNHNHESSSIGLYFMCIYSKIYGIALGIYNFSKWYNVMYCFILSVSPQNHFVKSMHTDKHTFKLFVLTVNMYLSCLLQVSSWNKSQLINLFSLEWGTVLIPIFDYYKQ